MTVITNISVDLLRPSLYPKVNAVKDDVCTRDVVISLYSGGVSWPVPEGVSAAVGYRKQDGTVGLYDTLPDGSSAVKISGNTVTLTLAAQMLTSAGTVETAVTLTDAAGNQISTFAFNVIVASNPGSGAVKSEDYFNYVNPMIQAVIDNAAAAAASANAAADRANAASEVAYEANRKADALREVVSKLHSNIVCEASGKMITLSDSAEAPLQGLRIFGKTEQATTTGKNLFDAQKYSSTPAGIEYTKKDDGSITINGTATATSQYIFHPFYLEPGEYIFSGIPGAASGVYYLTGNDGTTRFNVYSEGDNKVTITDGAITDLRIVVVTGKTVSNATYFPMIRLASITDDTYEPYTGGIPSPNPDYPQALESVGDGGSVTATVRGKNLFCLNDKMVPSTKDEVGYEINGNTVRVYTTVAATRAGIRMYDKIRLQKGVAYRFSAMVNGIVSGTPGLGIRDADTYVYIKRDAVSSAGVLSFTYTPDEDVNVFLYVLCTSGDSEDGDVTVSDIQFETGSAVTEYESYKEGGSVTVTPVDSSGNSLYLPGIPVTDANGQQWICDEVDFEQGVYVQRVGVLVLNGTQGRYSDSQGVFILDGLENAALKIYDKNFALCTHYAYGAYPNTSMPNMTFKVTLSSGVVNLYIKDSRYTTTQAFKDAFAASPVTVLYQLENSVQHMLTAEELAQYAALHTNYPNTTVCNDAGAYMEAGYIADTKIYVDNKFAELAAALVNNA